MNLQDIITQIIRKMKRNILLICSILIFSCHQKPKGTNCNDFIKGSFNGRAAIFFHKPISGSTYQVFLLPLCNTGRDNKSDSLSLDSLGTGISFNITSDNVQFKTLYKNAKKISLKGRDQMAENFRSIYYCFAKVEVLFDYNDTKKTIEESKELILESGRLILKFHFVSYVSFKIIDSLSLEFPRGLQQRMN